MYRIGILLLIPFLVSAAGQPITQPLEQPQQQSHQLVESARTLERWRYVGLGALRDENSEFRYKIVDCCDCEESEVPVFCALDYQALVACYICLSPGYTGTPGAYDEDGFACLACLTNAVGNCMLCTFATAIPLLTLLP